MVDVGANFGVFSLYVAIHHHPRRIVAYEPAAATVPLLRQNLAAVPGFEAHAAGLLDLDRRATLHHGDNAGLHSIHPAPDLVRGSEEIELRRASTELAARGVERLSVLKLDTEGCELAILRDLAGPDGLLERTDFVLLEYHAEPDRRAIDDLLRDRFLLYGGRIVRIGLGTLRYVARDVLARHPVIPNPAR